MRLIDADALDYGHYKGVPIPGDILISLNDVAKENKAATTIDPVHAAGGCYCRECCFGRKPHSADMQDWYVYCQYQGRYKQLDDFCSDGEPKEAQDA